MVRIVWGNDQMPTYVCAWHVLKAWCLRSMEKIKDNEMRCAILDDLHTVMYMPIESSESIETFMTCGRIKIIESFIQHLPSDSWIRYFWTYYFQVGTWINFQTIIVIAPCCAYPKIFTLWIEVKTPMVDLVMH
jgi:hypothetical protein